MLWGVGITLQWFVFQQGKIRPHHIAVKYKNPFLLAFKILDTDQAMGLIKTLLAANVKIPIYFHSTYNDNM